MPKTTAKTASPSRFGGADAPEDLLSALSAAPVAAAAFASLPSSHRREYVRWIEEAKREATRARRIAETIKRLADDRP